MPLQLTWSTEEESISERNSIMGSIRTEGQSNKFRIGVDVGGMRSPLTSMFKPLLISFAIRYKHRRCTYLAITDTDNRFT